MFEVVIGLEVHTQLNTKTKIFCSCSTSFGDEANTHVCPTCLALPGALPVLNKEAVDVYKRQTPSDIISILENLKRVGAIQVDLEII